MKKIVLLIGIILIYIFILLLWVTSLPNTKYIYNKRICDAYEYVDDYYSEYKLAREVSLNYKALTQTELSVFGHPAPGKNGSMLLTSEGNCVLASVFHSLNYFINMPLCSEKVVPEKEFISDSMIPRQEEVYLPNLYVQIRATSIKKYNKFEDFHFNELKEIFFEVGTEYGDVSYQIHKELNDNALSEIIKFIDDGHTPLPILNLYDHPYYKNHTVTITGYKIFKNKNDEKKILLEIIDGQKNTKNDFNVSYLDYSNLEQNNGRATVQIFMIKNIKGV